MKKLLALILALMMVLSLAACDSPNEEEPKATLNVDLSKYPEEFKDWTAQNVMDYFKESITFPEDCAGWYYDTEMWASDPVYDSAGFVKNDGTIQIMIYTFRSDASDTTPEKVEEWLNTFRNSNPHMYSDEFTTIGPASHLASNVLFVFERTVDEDYYNKIEAAYQQLISYFELKADF